MREFSGGPEAHLSRTPGSPSRSAVTLFTAQLPRSPEQSRGENDLNQRWVSAIRWICLLGRDSMNIGRKFTKGEFFEMDFLACIVDVNAYQIAFGVIIEHNTFRDFFAVNTWFFREIDIK